MHMADALLSPAVGGVMYAASGAAIAYSAIKVKKDELSEKKLPVMAVTGAFVFAAQMINFTIPGTGSSGHIGGGILLAAMLGGFPALLSLAAVLIIQCLFFADGGLLALGCNIFNIGVIPCLLVYPLIFKPIVKKGLTYRRITVASIVSVVAGLQIGAFGVVLQTLASGVTQLPFGTFAALMQPIHLAIGLIEGVITAAIVCFVYKCARKSLIAPSPVRALKAACPSKASPCWRSSPCLSVACSRGLLRQIPTALNGRLKKQPAQRSLSLRAAFMTALPPFRRPPPSCRITTSRLPARKALPRGRLFPASSAA